MFDDDVRDVPPDAVNRPAQLASQLGPDQQAVLLLRAERLLATPWERYDKLHVRREAQLTRTSHTCARACVGQPSTASARILSVGDPERTADAVETRSRRRCQEHAQAARRPQRPASAELAAWSNAGVAAHFAATAWHFGESLTGAEQVAMVDQMRTDGIDGNADRVRARVVVREVTDIDLFPFGVCRRCEQQGRRHRERNSKNSLHGHTSFSLHVSPDTGQAAAGQVSLEHDICFVCFLVMRRVHRTGRSQSPSTSPSGSQLLLGGFGSLRAAMSC